MVTGAVRSARRQLMSGEVDAVLKQCREALIVDPSNRVEKKRGPLPTQVLRCPHSLKIELKPICA